METEDVVAPAADWLKLVMAEARTAMLSAKIEKNCMVFVAKVSVARCWSSGRDWWRGKV